jgi:starch synthase
VKVALVASEAIPYAKTGGLADVIGALPVHLADLGIDVITILPKYKSIEASLKYNCEVDIGKTLTAKVYGKNSVFFVDYPEFFERDGLYGTERGDYPDNCERFALFCKAAARIIEKENVDIAHCHDWQSGLIPLYLRIRGLKTKSVFTIHNLGYQGKFPHEKYAVLGIDDSYFTPEGIEFYGDINFLKAGIVYSDVITTVSENYAREIQLPELGFGLDGILRKRKENLMGIVNGIDYQLWNPRSDNLIKYTYSTFEEKQRNKLFFCKDCNIDCDRPLIGMVSRIADQKGFDLILKAFNEMIAMGYNFILLGFGDKPYHEKLKQLEALYPDNVSVHIKFDNKIAHRIYAGSDFFLMPSRYEPCGLGQLISLKYGTVPIVRKTGGLADTVTEFNPEDLSGNGFVFEDYSAEHMLDAMRRAYAVYIEPVTFGKLSGQCMAYDFSWKTSAKKYKRLYNSL